MHLKNSSEAGLKVTGVNVLLKKKLFPMFCALYHEQQRHVAP